MNALFSKKIDLIKEDRDLWDLYTGREEYKPHLVDRFGRYPYYTSKNRDLFDPAVSRLLKDHDLAIEYPGNKEFAICLTHDIDAIRSARYYAAIDIIRHLYELRIKDALQRPLQDLFSKYNPLKNFRDIMALESKYDAKSSFYFMALEENDQDFNYRLEELSHEIEYIADNGWEVGLHGGHEAFNNIGRLKREKHRLEKIKGSRVKGYRGHFLRFRTPDTWEILKDAGFKYDTTYGFPDCVGFRNGMCHPFKPFNLNSGKEIDILEIPLIIMDTTLGDAYMRLDDTSSWRLVRKLVDIVEKNSGVLTILWHNSSMIGEGGRYYERFLRYCKGKNAWMTSAEEIHGFWIN